MAQSPFNQEDNMIAKTTVHQEAHYQVTFNSQVNAYRPYSVVNTATGQTLFRCNSLGLCLDYIGDSLR